MFMCNVIVLIFLENDFYSLSIYAPTEYMFLYNFTLAWRFQCVCNRRAKDVRSLSNKFFSSTEVAGFDGRRYKSTKFNCVCVRVWACKRSDSFPTQTLRTEALRQGPLWLCAIKTRMLLCAMSEFVLINDGASWFHSWAQTGNDVAASSRFAFALCL